MKFLHTSDWHVGRTLNGWSLLEEQEGPFNRLWIWLLAKKWMGLSLLETSMTVRCRLWMPLSF